MDRSLFHFMEYPEICYYSASSLPYYIYALYLSESSLVLMAFSTSFPILSFSFLLRNSFHETALLLLCSALSSPAKLYIICCLPKISIFPIHMQHISIYVCMCSIIMTINISTQLIFDEIC